MTLQTRPRPITHAQRAAPDASWPEPPRVYRSEGEKAPHLVVEARWVGASGGAAPLPATPVAPALTPGLARLLNAALIDPTFAALFLGSPIAAARRVVGAVGELGELLGTTLPDPALRLTLPALSETEWAVLGHMPRATSLEAAARELRRLCSLAEGAASAAAHAVDAADAAPRRTQGAAGAHRQSVEPDRALLLHEGWSPARREGALAGAA